MKKYFILIIITIIYSQTAKGQEYRSIFGGEDLKGWKVPENNRWWSASEGILKARSGPDRTGTIIWTEGDFQDFIVELEFRFVSGTVDSGIFLRSDKHQIQLGISASLKVDMTGSPYIAGRAYPVKAELPEGLLRQKDWNQIAVKVVGTIYQVWLNEVKVLSFDSEEEMKPGPIGLQIHQNNDMSIDFRKIRIAEL